MHSVYISRHSPGDATAEFHCHHMQATLLLWNAAFESNKTNKKYNLFRVRYNTDNYKRNLFRMFTIGSEETKLSIKTLSLQNCCNRIYYKRTVLSCKTRPWRIKHREHSSGGCQDICDIAIQLQISLQTSW